MKTLGVIGGLGPMATAYYMELVIQMTDASCDQEHLPMIIYNRPDTPDRTRYILGLSNEDPQQMMVETGRALVRQGADRLVIPCITAHYFHSYLESQIGKPVLNLIEETAAHLKKFGWSTIGIMATDGTIRSGLFQKELERLGMKAVIPSEESQKKVMHLIYENVKAGKPVELSLFQEAEAELRAAGAQVIVLGCTELSMIKKDFPIGPGFLDAMEVLAMRAIEECDAPLKEEYHCLVTR
ncbi:aspartate/glutamate racemase family protein [Hominifimenecus sp. rT4P-3]|uniref:aspartate/glutamate racemase family protein n=1 Tax=Hominifimenecus sp. rT4P-3 TaxID=3242979 RepID=UPI003DA3701A